MSANFLFRLTQLLHSKWTEIRCLISFNYVLAALILAVVNECYSFLAVE